MSKETLYTDRTEINALSERLGGFVFATYSFPAQTLENARVFAVQIAAGQTLGYMPESVGENLDYMARIFSVELRGNGRATAELAFPRILFGSDTAGILTILFGKISFAPGIKLESIKGDQNFLSKVAGPRIGLVGIRKILGISEARPLLMAILKPGIGPDNLKLASQFGELVAAGVDIVKDDEVRVDIDLDAAKRRLQQVLEAGRGKGLYVMALNGPAFELKSRALSLQKGGANAFLVCPYTYGISVLQSLCEDPEIVVPVFAHPAFTGIMSHGGGGIEPEVSMGSLMRWSGADGVLYPSPYGAISLEKLKAVSVHQNLIRTEVHLKASASIPSAGILPAFVADIRRDFGTNVVINAGTGMAKSGGSISGGVKAFLAEISLYY
ncbi:MAG: RuBisCO large subunit C-terminal-like domain-containing protein [Proteobacteria bacterium]|nr:RuBisCO large subunit C-terminal-like domain-containing protein [Pseudomonadota bacterium]